MIRSNSKPKKTTQMSWLARSIANSLRIDEDFDANNHNSLSSSHRRRLNPTAPENDVMEERESDRFEGDLRGVKDDLGEFKETLTRQLWGVANFLAPPPTTTTCSSSQSHDQRVISESNRSESTDPSISGDEHGDSSVNSRNSTANRNFSEIRVLENCNSSLNSRRLGLQKVEEEEDEDDDDDGDSDDGDDDGINQAVGLTDEVLTFAGDIGHHPETWLDFPVDDEEQFEGMAFKYLFDYENC